MKPLYILIVLLSEIARAAAQDGDSSIHQDSGVETALVGQSVSFPCKYRSDTANFISWYKQSLGSKPDIISTRMMLNKNASVYPAYEDRFQVVVKKEESTDLLIIEKIKLSDSATYYCGILEFNAIEFGAGVFLHVKSSSSSMKPVINQPALERLRVGDSVNLSCTVYSEPCEGEQSFYWFRHSVAQSAVMYHSKGQCRTDPESYNKRNCTLNLAIKSVNVSDAGMYYCALASCGETVFGNGTKVQIEGLTEVLVSCLSVALAVAIIVLLVLASIMYKLKTESNSVCEGAVSTTCDALSQDADSLHYAALSVKGSSERHRPERSMDTDCVYSRLKSRKE
ncbi:uncharacterized protein LOC141784481 [Halichoeres trimaculatus]|uniref:uncharacterized protein LOC141784481 n=1 Tax=Halichoeres trimaculatus TaxID=147232 RepID=UPI003D9E8904